MWNVFLYSVEGGMPLQDSSLYNIYIVFFLIIVSSFNNVAIISFRVLYFMVFAKTEMRTTKKCAKKNRELMLRNPHAFNTRIGRF